LRAESTLVKQRDQSLVEQVGRGQHGIAVVQQGRTKKSLGRRSNRRICVRPRRVRPRSGFLQRCDLAPKR
jgi:hypothetical protein